MKAYNKHEESRENEKDPENCNKQKKSLKNKWLIFKVLKLKQSN
jgi:hypothetical protein